MKSHIGIIVVVGILFAFVIAMVCGVSCAGKIIVGGSNHVYSVAWSVGSVHVRSAKQLKSAPKKSGKMKGAGQKYKI